MKKTLLLVLSVLFFFSLFSQEDDSYIADIDDFDSIFEDAQDLEEAVSDTEEKPETAVQVVASAFSSMVHFSGNFSGSAGIAYAHKYNEDGKNDNASGIVSLKNTLNMTVAPVNTFVVRGSVYTGIDNGFTVAVNSFYFDYLLLDRFYLSAGKKSISWGNIRLFNSDYYGGETHSGGLYCTGPKHADIFSEDGAPLALDIKYPWSWGTLTFAATGNYTDDLKPNAFNYYGSLEVSFLNTNLNLFAKRPAKNTEPVRTNLAGLEIKKTLFGFDTYAQGIVRIKDIKSLDSTDGYDYVTATAGFYHLFDSFEPNIGFNIEYQYEYNPSLETEHYNRIAFEGGLKRIGKRKNIKIGVLSHYNITENHGYSGLNFIVSGILPYADWSNKVAVGYGSKYEIPVILASSTIELALDY